MKRCIAPLAGGLLLAAATPPAAFPGAEFLVLVGLLVWYRLATSPTSCWCSWLLGAVHLAFFSWSVRHVLFAAWVAIVLVGGCYFVLGTLAVRASPARARVAAFAVAVAGTFWLRANLPEICYPHGQPCHALWQWPVLLGSVVVGGEGLANGLLGALAAAACELGRSWRLAVPAWPAAARGAIVVGVLAVACTVAGNLVLAPSAEADGPRVRVGAIEPGYHLVHEMQAVPAGEQPARYRQLVDERLLQPTHAALGASSPPDVVLWPESSLLDTLERRAVLAGTARVPARWAATPTTLVLGLNVRDEAPPTPAAVVVELPSGRVVAHQEKRRLVPGGEVQPFVRWLPASWSAAIRAAFEQALGSMPEATPGEELPPLRDARGVSFGALLCYDNAFPEPARAQVERGARWLAVLSNESWYEGGGELTQLAAMTVLRALETGTPIVRCTMDGWTLWVDGRGRLRDVLPLAPAPQPRARVLLVDVPLGPGTLPPGALLRAAFGPAAGAGLGGLLLLAAWRRWRRGKGGMPAAAVGIPPRTPA